MGRDIGSKVRQIRELKNLTQEHMADRLGMSQRGYSKLERDEVKLDWERITQISKVFEMEPMDLVSFDDNLIFNNCTQSGKIHEQHNHNLPDKLIEQYEARIKALTDEVAFLREEMRKR
jgi:transcriptional regulator with XRE-family HTH domain